MTGRRDLWRRVDGCARLSRRLRNRTQQTDIEVGHQRLEVSARVAYEVPVGQNRESGGLHIGALEHLEVDGILEEPGAEDRLRRPGYRACNRGEGWCPCRGGVGGAAAWRRVSGGAKRHGQRRVPRVRRCRQFACVQIEYVPIAEFSLHTRRLGQFGPTALQGYQVRAVAGVRSRKPVGDDNRDPSVVITGRELGIAEVHFPHMGEQGQFLLGGKHLSNDGARYLQHIAGAVLGDTLGGENIRG